MGKTKRQKTSSVKSRTAEKGNLSTNNTSGQHMTREEKNQALSDMLYLSACAIRGIRPEKSRVSRMNMENLYRVSRFHALTNIVFEAVLSACDGKLPDTPVLKKWREARDKAVTKNLLLDAERAALFAWMEQAGIWYLPLKGCILKDLYPKSGMRQMADNDILFDAAGQERVRDWFVARGYEVKAYKQSVHDSYLKKPVYNFEMHTALFSDTLRPENTVWVDYYRDVKQRLLPDGDGRYGYRFSDEDFYIYITAHACKHYRNGGTGLRTLLDCYVYLSAKGDSLNWDYIRTELAKLKLVDFERETRELSQKVFADDQKNCDIQETQQLSQKAFAAPEKFSTVQLSEAERQLLGRHLASGTYGTTEQRVKNILLKLTGTEGGVSKSAKLRYVWGRLFPNRAFMEVWCRIYAPFFLRHERLMPLAVVWRIFRNGLTHVRRCLHEFDFVTKV